MHSRNFPEIYSPQFNAIRETCAQLAVGVDDGVIVVGRFDLLEGSNDILAEVFGYSCSDIC